MKYLKANRLSHFAYGEIFPTPNQIRLRQKFEARQRMKYLRKMPRALKRAKLLTK